MWNGSRLRVALIILLAGYAWGTHTYAEVWANEITLWAHAVEQAPTKARPRANYIVALQRAGRADEAWRQLEEAQQVVRIPAQDLARLEQAFNANATMVQLTQLLNRLTP